jgi:hypothetical protein
MFVTNNFNGEIAFPMKYKFGDNAHTKSKNKNVMKI